MAFVKGFLVISIVCNVFRAHSQIELVEFPDSVNQVGYKEIIFRFQEVDQTLRKSVSRTSVIKPFDLNPFNGEKYGTSFHTVYKNDKNLLLTFHYRIQIGNELLPDGHEAHIFHFNHKGELLHNIHVDHDVVAPKCTINGKYLAFRRGEHLAHVSVNVEPGLVFYNLEKNIKHHYLQGEYDYIGFYQGMISVLTALPDKAGWELIILDEETGKIYRKKFQGRPFSTGYMKIADSFGKYNVELDFEVLK